MLTDPRGRRRVRWQTAIVLACLPAVHGAQSPQTPVFRSGASVVPLTVTVLDQKGLPVTDLTAADFTVHENGRERSIINFFPQFMGPESGRVRPAAVESPGTGLAPA